MVKQGPKRGRLKFWLEAGTKDEAADRNNNGIIDAIDDTLDLITALKRSATARAAIFTISKCWAAGIIRTPGAA